MKRNCDNCGAKFQDAEVLASILTCAFCGSQKKLENTNEKMTGLEADLAKAVFLLENAQKVGDFQKAARIFEQAIAVDFENPTLYLNLLLAQTFTNKEENLAHHNRPLTRYTAFRKALSLGDNGLKERLLSYSKAVEKTVAVRNKKTKKQLGAVLAALTIAAFGFLFFRNRTAQAKEERVASFLSVPYLVDMLHEDPSRARMLGDSLFQEHTAAYFLTARGLSDYGAVSRIRLDFPPTAARSLTQIRLELVEEFDGLILGDSPDFEAIAAYFGEKYNVETDFTDSRIRFELEGVRFEIFDNRSAVAINLNEIPQIWVTATVDG